MGTKLSTVLSRRTLSGALLLATAAAAPAAAG